RRPQWAAAAVWTWKYRPPPEDVVNFYTQAMSAKGWQPGMAVVQGPVGILQLNKETGQIVIKATVKGQKSIVNIAVMKQ
ncbi:MAG: hypothetical protein ACQET7_05930, partial [Thermodesulfobacteriota bacterium]